MKLLEKASGVLFIIFAVGLFSTPAFASSTFSSRTPTGSTIDRATVSVDLIDTTNNSHLRVRLDGTGGTSNFLLDTCVFPNVGTTQTYSGDPPPGTYGGYTEVKGLSCGNTPTVVQAHTDAFTIVSVAHVEPGPFSKGQNVPLTCDISSDNVGIYLPDGSLGPNRDCSSGDPIEGVGDLPDGTYSVYELVGGLNWGTLTEALDAGSYVIGNVTVDNRPFGTHTPSASGAVGIAIGSWFTAMAFKRFL